MAIACRFPEIIAPFPPWRCLSAAVAVGAPGLPPTCRRQYNLSGNSLGAVCAAATQLASCRREGRRYQAASCFRQPRHRDEAMAWIFAKRGTGLESRAGGTCPVRSIAHAFATASLAADAAALAALAAEFAALAALTAASAPTNL